MTPATVTPPGDELVFEPDTATAAAGLVTVAWHNESKLSLDLPRGPAGQGRQVDRGNGLLRSGQRDTAISGSLTETYQDLKPGKYTFYCGVDEHRAQGMEGTLTVE